MKSLILGIFLIIFLSINSIADELEFKSGGSIEADRIWTEGDSVRCQFPSGQIYDFPKDKVERIVTGKPSGSDSEVISDRQSDSRNLASSKGILNTYVDGVKIIRQIRDKCVQQKCKEAYLDVCDSNGIKNGSYKAFVDFFKEGIPASFRESTEAQRKQDEYHKQIGVHIQKANLSSDTETNRIFEPYVKALFCGGLKAKVRWDDYMRQSNISAQLTPLDDGFCYDR